MTFSLVACGVSQEDYDALAEKNSSLQEQAKELQAEVEALQLKIDTLSAENEELNTDYLALLDEKTEQALSDYDVVFGNDKHIFLKRPLKKVAAHIRLMQ